MKKIIMLTICLVCSIILLVGCKNGNTSTDANKEDNVLVEDSLTESVPDDVEDVCEYNEAGKIIIVMFHRFGEEEKDEWTRSYENFYADLKYLYDKGYRTISLNDYINNNIKVPVGCTPIIFTFDDGSKGEFNLIKDENGNLISNPNSAVGIMERFYKEYPEFGLNGTFYINESGYFSGEGTKTERLKYLIDRGFEIGNHTSTHCYLNKISKDEIEKEIGKVVKSVSTLTDGYNMTSLALPFGISSKEYGESVISGTYEDVSYENKAILLVGSNPAPSPNSENLNLLKLPRVRATGGNKRVDCDLYYWLEKMEKNPEMKYYRKK